MFFSKPDEFVVLKNLTCRSIFPSFTSCSGLLLLSRLGTPLFFGFFFSKGYSAFLSIMNLAKVVNDCDAIQPFLLGYSRTKHLQIGVPVMYSEIHFALRCEYKFN